MQNLLVDLTELLQSDQSFISDGAILKNAVIEAALNMDPSLLELLMQSPKIKAHFFTEVSGALIFDKVKFQGFVLNKAFLPDSYTAFKNRIGLADGRGDYLSQAREVVLAWPYKDCVLEGGMTKADQGRNEVFWNTTLAPDDITRLLEPKVLTSWERWDAAAVASGKPKAVGEVSEDDNLLIKGNNLLALHSLKVRYADKVKLIYIDPPYNTGNDDFRYNDRFNHSAWLTFMRNRLEVAKSLLSQDGVIFLNLDDGEAHYCKVLMDEVFGRENFIANVVWQKKYTRSNDARWFSDNHDHILVFAKNASKFHVNLLPKTEKQLKAYKNPDGHEKGVWKATPLHAKSGTDVGRYKYTFKNGRTWEPPQNTFPRFSKETLAKLEYNNEIYFGVDGTAEPSRKTFLSETKDGLTPITVWGYEEFGHNHEANTELKNLKLSYFFGNPKPERLLQAIVTLATNTGDLVLDFYAGSGTTAAVAHKMGRRWIAVEQMDYIKDLTATRIKKVIEGEQGGISKAVAWKGSGSFVYAELAASNSDFADRIDAAPDMSMLQTIHADMQATGYLHYDVDLSAFDIAAFAALSLDDAKCVLMDCLDANHLYVNLSSLGDADFEISDEDARATRSFYRITA
jgi:adenine-specific DNA-methyltransferase